ncbi:MAG: putative FmdB family regulatory protein [Verrucomicrobiales bacterium]|jgi:putative FmdB family regulatory protein
MPTYEYECTKCDHTFEAFQQMSAEPIKKCPECKCKVKRLIGTGAGLLFKGGGFYETDYRSEGYKQAEKKESESNKASSETSGDKATKEPAKKEAKSETKPAKKPAAKKSAKKPASKSPGKTS